MVLMRSRCTALIAILVLLASSACADDFIISHWCGPPPGGDVDVKIAEVAECNFTHAMFPCSGATPADNKAMLDACQRHGLKYILIDGRRDSYAAADPAFAANLDSLVADYASHPALGGYYLADEPGMHAFPQLAAVNQHLLKKDPQRLPYINLLPNYATVAMLGSDYETYVDSFCVTVKPKLLSYDHYALFEGVERDSYFANVETIRRAGLKHAIPFGFIFQTTPHGTYRDPSETDLRWQVNTALAYGCKALFYFTYFTPTDPAANFHNGIIDAQGKRTSHYGMAKRINAELKTLAPTLMALTSTAVYHTPELPAGAVELPADAAIRTTAPASLVIGLFNHQDGSRWAIVVNRDMRQPTLARLELETKIKSIEELSPQTGELTQLAHDGPLAGFHLPPGGLKILKLAY
jgi:hypothetical protein